MSEMLNEKRPISERTIYNIVNSFPILNFEWLCYGDGEMIKGGNQGEISEVKSKNYNERMVVSVEKIAESCANVSEANKILANSNSDLVVQLAKLMDEIREMRKAMYPDASSKTAERVSDIKGGFTQLK